MNMPQNFAALARLNRQQLQTLHAQGSCPDPNLLNGIAKGMVLDPIWFERLHLWRGKVFHHAHDGTIGGVNRLGVGAFEYLRYRFELSVGQSAFSDRQVILLNHDLPENPYHVRIFHDELVQLQPQLFLASSHLKIAGKLRYISYFAFDFGQM